MAASAAILLGSVPSVVAQDLPRAEVSGGYQFLNVTVEDASEVFGTGWYADIAGNLTRHLGVAFQVGGSYKSITETQSFGNARATIDADFRVHHFMVGARLKARPNPTIAPFAEILVGAVTLSLDATGTANFGGSSASFSAEESGTDFGLQVGGGADFPLSDRIGIRVGADYVRVYAEEAVNTFRFAAGVVLPIGR
jgi:opacity protein-like surface antigen